MPEAAAPNVDQAEIQKFADIASRWWDLNGEFAPLHAINPLRLGFIKEHTALSGKQAIDVGCGGGILSEALAAEGARTTGLDMGDEQLNVAKLHLLESGLEVNYVKRPVEEMAAEKAGQFDVVTCMEMLEHVPDPASVVEACAELAKPGATVVFSTINRNPKAYALAVVGAEYLLNMLPKGTHDYAKFIKPSELGSWARAAGLQVKAITGIHYNPLFKSYNIGPNTDVNYIMAFEKT